ncbi:MAG: GldM family protein [Haliscomenobacter sp.]|uniref:GldM family protein n=1 Tax=Haliscomenobacter sp. TaxID=2717303 RepID=UPI0029B739A0|nr:GldM family protein [Haliscomenobacter sp.]MDX2069926.1 GldM family protein [Haliscomenobacter sp.]
MQNTLLILVTITCFSSSVLDLKKPQVAVSTRESNYLYQGVDNPVTIVARQNQAVQANQITAEMDTFDSNEVFYVQVHGKNGEFLIKPKQVGQLTLKVKTRDGVWEKKFHVRPIEPVAMFGGQKKNGTMSPRLFRAQGGVIPVLECCGFDARCDIVEYSIIKISKDGVVHRARNIGGKFNDSIRPLIDSAQPGDIYWFRKILCRCPGNTQANESTDIAIDIE